MTQIGADFGIAPYRRKETDGISDIEKRQWNFFVKLEIFKKGVEIEKFPKETVKIQAKIAVKNEKTTKKWFAIEKIEIASTFGYVLVGIFF